MHFKHIRKIMIMNYTKVLKIRCFAILHLQYNGYIWNLRMCIHMFIIIHINLIPKVADPPNINKSKGDTWYKIQ